MGTLLAKITERAITANLLASLETDGGTPQAETIAAQVWAYAVELAQDRDGLAVMDAIKHLASIAPAHAPIFESIWVDIWTFDLETIAAQGAVLV